MCTQPKLGQATLLAHVQSKMEAGIILYIISREWLEQDLFFIDCNPSLSYCLKKDNLDIF